MKNQITDNNRIKLKGKLFNELFEKEITPKQIKIETVPSNDSYEAYNYRKIEDRSYPVNDDGLEYFLPFIALTFIAKFNLDVLQYKSFDKLRKKAYKATITNNDPEIILFDGGYIKEESMDEDKFVFSLNNGKEFLVEEVEINYFKYVQFKYEDEIYYTNTKFDDYGLVKGLKFKDVFLDILLGGHLIIRKELAQIDYYFEKHDDSKGSFNYIQSSAKYLYTEENEDNIIRELKDMRFKYLELDQKSCEENGITSKDYPIGFIQIEGVKTEKDHEILHECETIHNRWNEFVKFPFDNKKQIEVITDFTFEYDFILQSKPNQTIPLEVFGKSYLDSFLESIQARVIPENSIIIGHSNIDFWLALNHVISRLIYFREIVKLNQPVFAFVFFDQERINVIKFENQYLKRLKDEYDCVFIPISFDYENFFGIDYYLYKKDIKKVWEMDILNKVEDVDKFQRIIKEFIAMIGKNTKAEESSVSLKTDDIKEFELFQGLTKEKKEEMGIKEIENSFIEDSGNSEDGNKPTVKNSIENKIDSSKTKKNFIDYIKQDNLPSCETQISEKIPVTLIGNPKNEEDDSFLIGKKTNRDQD